MRFLLLFVNLLFALSLTSCVSAYKESMGGESVQVFDRIYLTDFNVAWQAVLDALKSIHLDTSNREGGYIQTKWIENTSEKNFTDSFDGANSYLKAQYRFKITLAKGRYQRKPNIRVRVQKEQLVQKDVLDGWKPIESDSIDENTLLYRIGQIIYIKMKLAELEDAKAQRELKNATF